jgi:hypothetical protein
MPVSKRVAYAHIEGLREFLQGMGVAKREMENAERVFGAIAAATVINTAKQNASGVSRLAAKAAQDLRVVGSNTVQYGGKPYSFGAEFGAVQWHQFREWRGNQDDAGYFLWPAIREFRNDDMLDLWVKEVWSVMEKAFVG